MNKVQLIEKIETEITNGSTDTKALVEGLLQSLYENSEIYDHSYVELSNTVYATLKRNGDKVQIDFETRRTGSGHILYFYKIS